MIPAWLARRLEQRGLLDTDGFAREAAAGRCRRCGVLVLRGLDEDVIALCATVDIDPTNTVGEFLALAAGRLTYTLRQAVNSSRRKIWVLDRRYSEIIAAARPAVVMVEHRCGHPLPHGETPKETKKQHAPLPDEPPF